MIVMSSSITDGCAFQVLDIVQQGDNLSVAGYQYACTNFTKTRAEISHLFELRNNNVTTYNNNDLSLRENSPKFMYKESFMPVSQLRLDG